MHILLVEDDETCKEIVGAALRKHGHEVTAVFNGRQALALLGSGIEPDLLLTDIQLPGGLDGWELARIFKDAFPDLGVVYITARAPDIDPVSNSIYLLKPIMPSLLVQAVAAIAPQVRVASARRVIH